jgi:hypothetical protein
MLKQVESPIESPEALIRALDLELATRRAKRGDSQQNRHLVLAVGMLVLLIGGAAALFMLFGMVNDLPRHQGSASSESQAATQP